MNWPVLLFLSAPFVAPVVVYKVFEWWYRRGRQGGL